MSGIKKIQKSDILNAALEIVRENGLECLQTRNIASKLKCSTQPIFYQFSNMEELKKELMEKIMDIYIKYVIIDKEVEKPYKESGIGYINFAKNEPELFRVIFMSPNNMTQEKLLINDEESYKKIIKGVMKATGIKDEERARKFHLKMWTFTHGIATLITTKTCEISDKEISEMLTEEFTALMLLERGNKDE